MKKNYKNQGFKTLDLMVLIVLFSLAALLVTAIISVNLDSPQRAKALIDAESLALQLASGGLESIGQQTSLDSRAPASLSVGTDYKRSMRVFGKKGKIAKDPWGNAYHYDFIEDESHKKLFISVWSYGPNKTKNTQDEALKVHQTDGKNFLVLQGDDLGYVHEIAVDK